MRPFLLACSTRNPKFAGSGIVGLQRLVVANALPKDTLNEVLEAFRECSTLALDIQLKVLQALPSLLQNYAGSLTGRLLITAFQVCFLLYNNKTAVVSNTAAASLQQLVNSTFDKVTTNVSGQSRDDPPTDVPIPDGSVSIYGAALDAYRLLEDLSLLTDGQRPKTLLGATLAQNFGFELLESILGNHADTIMAHPEQIHVFRTKVVPLVIKIFSEKASFPSTVRTMRLLQLIVSRLLFALAEECEMALSLLNHMLDPDAAVPWKRALCLEVFRSLHAEPALIRSIYSNFDGAENKRNIIRDHLGSLVRLASEKPALIGLGQQSSVPSSLEQSDDSDEQATIQAGGLAGSIGASVPTSDINRLGISTQWSNVRIPCIDLLDKSEAPNLPATYIYSLALTCITTFSEGLARFLLPFTVPGDAKSKRRQPTSQEGEEGSNVEGKAGKPLSRTQSFGGRRTPINPLNLKEHALHSQISTSGHMVEHCWPALLAASSTFLNATLDSENYHALIRSFQKFTQIAGLLDLATPRDAFLTTLGKHAVPAMNSTAVALPTNGRSMALSEDETTDSDREPSPSPSKRQQAMERALPTINTRHLLCLRALLNLGIALGPVLGESWTIILESLLQADLILSESGQARRKQSKRSASNSQNETTIEKADSSEDLGLEITAAETAASRLLEATADLANEAFLNFLQRLTSLLTVGNLRKSATDILLSPGPTSRKHQKVRSVSEVALDGATSGHSDGFVIDKINNVIQSNVARLTQPATSESGWDLLTDVLNTTINSQKTRPEIRIKAANALNDLLVAVAVSEEPLSVEERDSLRERSLDALYHEIALTRENSQNITKASRSCGLEVHRLALESLKSILEDCGDSLDVGWQSVLSIINSIYNTYHLDSKTIQEQTSSPKLVRSAFDSLQLVCSDFLTSIPSIHLGTLLDTLYAFCAQDQDLNISLTTTTFSRNISDYLQRDDAATNFDLYNSLDPSDTNLMEWAKDVNSGKSTSALWLYLLSRLRLLSTDSRLEVRHSALHTLFRIFDTCLEQLTTKASDICFKTVLSKLLKDNEEKYMEAKGEEEAEQSMLLARDWNHTVIVEIEGISHLFCQLLEMFRGDETMEATCRDLLRQYTSILGRESLDVSRAIFTGTAKILGVIQSEELVGPEHPILSKSWEMWKDGSPALHQDDTERPKNDNQDTLISYLKCLEELIRLSGEQLALEQIEATLRQLRSCVTDSTASAYTADVDRMTPVQESVLNCLTSIPIIHSDAIPQIVQSINGFVTLAYEQEDDNSRKQQTYVALSKAAMDLQQSFCIGQITRPDIDKASIIVASCHSLATPIHLKYKWRAEGKGVPPWRKATTTAVTILEALVPLIGPQLTDAPQFWEVIVKIIDGVISADCDSCADEAEIPKDQDFDTDAFSTLKRLAVPSLGAASIADAVRRKFAESIFNNSLVHEPNIDDLARPGQELLEGLRNEHIGRVKDLLPTPRSKLSYLLLDELFSLVAVHDGSTERIKLAQAAAPYLILRAGLTLKAYILDQPLRGLMPQPWYQKKEMLYILKKLIELDSETKAIPAAPGLTSEHKKHLHRLYPLVMKSLRAAWRDEEMTQALKEVLDAVGDDFGI